MHKPFVVRVKLFAVRFIIFLGNSILRSAERVLFRSASSSRNILIYKIGNIGDIVCAAPALIAIRRNFPEATITLLTSPGKRGAPGAKELLAGAWYIDELKVYYADDIDTASRKQKFIKALKQNHYDLFIQLPDDLASFQTLLRNALFAKAIGAKSAIGFRMRTIQLFKKAQVDFSTQETETESLLDLLRLYGIKADRVEFDFTPTPKSSVWKDENEWQKNAKRKSESHRGESVVWGFTVPLEEKRAVAAMLQKMKVKKGELLVAMSPGGKRTGNQWPLERFREVAEYLKEKHGAKIVILGGKDDVPKAGLITKNIPDALCAAGELSFLGTFELLKSCSFLISNSTGTIHLGAAAHIPTIGLYTIRDVFGRWFPFGDNHILLKHAFLDCDYREEECIEQSLKRISVEEVIAACDTMISIA